MVYSKFDTCLKNGCYEKKFKCQSNKLIKVQNAYLNSTIFCVPSSELMCMSILYKSLYFQSLLRANYFSHVVPWCFTRNKLL